MSAAPAGTARMCGGALGAAAGALAALAALAAAAAPAGAQRVDSAARPLPTAATDTFARRIVVRDRGPGAAGRLLQATLARPHLALTAGDSGVQLRRGARFERTVVVVGGDARVAGTVLGDVLVVGGDLYLQPGAAIEGRAVAIGGSVYNSTLARVRAERLSYRDLTFVEVPGATGELALAYRSLGPQLASRVSLPGRFGLRVPAYDRINGLSLTFGPEIALDTGRVRVEPLVTYRSHLGEVDPSLVVRATPGRRTTLALRAGRGTQSNEIWIRNDLLNSALALGAGIDVRNYYRADRAELTAARSWESTSTTLTPYIGALYERAWSVARDVSAQSRPYSVVGRDDREEGMLRTNPRVTGGRIASALAGAAVQVEGADVTGGAGARLEVPLASPGDARWVQLTLDGELAFPAFRDHRFDALVHAVATIGDVPPTQRLVYLGGSGTIPTAPLLSEAGDQLAWLESRYTIPLPFVRVPFGGVPFLTLRHIVGGADVGGLGSLTQNVGIRLTVAALRVDYTIDPARSGSGQFGFGIGFR